MRARSLIQNLEWLSCFFLLAIQPSIAQLSIGSAARTIVSTNTIDSTNIKNGSISGADVKNSTLTMSKLAIGASGFVDVRKFGAVGDGVTDDAAAIQSAIDYAYASLTHYDIFIPAGNYLLFGTTSIKLKPGISIYGVSGLSILTRNNTTGSAIQFDNDHSYPNHTDNNVTVRNLVIYGASDGMRSGLTPGTGSDGGVIICGNCGGTYNNVLGRVEINNVWVYNTNKEAIQIWDADEAIITNCYVENCNFDAYNPARNRHTILTNNYADSVQYGIEFTGVSSLVGHDLRTSANISSNKLTNVYRAGMRILGGSNVIVNANVLLGRGGANNYDGGNGILIDSDIDTLQNITISNNTISDFTWYGIDIEHDNDGYLISNVDILNNNITDNYLSAIRADAYTPVNLKHLRIKGNALLNWNKGFVGSSLDAAGLYVNNVDSTLVEGNTIRSYRGGTVTYPAFFQSTDGCTVTGNDFTSAKNSYIPTTTSTLNTNFLVYNNIGSQGVYNLTTASWINQLVRFTPTQMNIQTQVKFVTAIIDSVTYVGTDSVKFHFSTGKKTALKLY